MLVHSPALTRDLLGFNLQHERIIQWILNALWKICSLVVMTGVTGLIPSFCNLKWINNRWIREAAVNLSFSFRTPSTSRKRRAQRHVPAGSSSITSNYLELTVETRTHGGCQVTVVHSFFIHVSSFFLQDYISFILIANLVLFIPGIFCHLLDQE